MSKQSFKDLVDKVSGQEKDPVVYDFKAPAGKGNTSKTKKPGQFKKPANEEGTGIYE